MDISIIQRRKEFFWSRVEKTDNCWLWTGTEDGLGYGRLYITERPGPRSRTSAHRFSYELHFGPVKDGLCVLHHCDNPICVRPDHLFIGTKGDNNRDRASKGRGADQRGRRNPNAKLTEEEVIRIHTLVSRGISNREIAKRLDIHPKTVGKIRRGSRWGHLHPDAAIRKMNSGSVKLKKADTV